MSRITDRKQALKLLKEIDTSKKDYFIIHYASESFFDLKGRSPRITSIAIEDLESGQCELFAIYKTAEKMGHDFDTITADNYSEIELNMLIDYFEFVAKNQNKKWIHWQMRDTIYGFKAIEHRYEVLTNNHSTFQQIPDSNKINIATIFEKLYGPNYVSDPKMVSLMEMNDLKPRNFLNGVEEAQAFTEGKYYELSMSTSGKVRMFSNMLNYAIDKKLKTNTSTMQLYGTGIKALWFSFKEKPLFLPISWIASLIFGGYLLKWLGL
ncbi:hypothetical protein BJM29_12190 [Listeria monocytogenes]|uniref:hypothetical protein n=1 Tax=Listeria monocytogenes TaxID=1639 RepID=UPI00087431B8|nr:hypothetical protein [Listeria monocytogenes]OFF73217.1 hypothetical protein BJM29_12190 [Listeria monocytogenes]